MANTVWNVADKSANVSLSGANLIATSTSGLAGGVRAVDRQVTGKFYWEYTCNVNTITGTAVGISSPNLALNVATTSGTGICALVHVGQVYVDGSLALNFGVTITSGTLICIAVDADARLVWFRIGAAGNWNNSASNNPATGVGGLSVINLGRGIPIFPTAWFSATSEQTTANFGDTAFTGAVPSGYTSGFPTGNPSPVIDLLCHADGANGSTSFTDELGHTLTATSATVSTTSPKFGTGSASFGTTASRLDVGGSVSDFSFGSRQFTVEAFANFSSLTGTQRIASVWSGSSNLGWTFSWVANTLSFLYSTTGTDFPSVSGTFSPTTNTWYHLAVDRDAANVVRVYVDGAVVGSATVASTIFRSTLALVIGNDGGNVRGLLGKLDEIRITNGQARYGGAFTPPAVPLSIIGDPYTNAIASQALAEHWLTTSPQAQVTQVLVEHWMSVAEGTPVVPDTQGPRVMVLA